MTKHYEVVCHEILSGSNNTFFLNYEIIIQHRVRYIEIEYVVICKYILHIYTVYSKYIGLQYIRRQNVGQ